MGNSRLIHKSPATAIERTAVAMQGLLRGHEDPFPPPKPGVRYVISKRTIAGTHGNERDAPKAAAAAHRIAAAMASRL